MFTGEFRHTIDGKGRVAVPARFRADLAAGATVCRWLENCVAIFPKAQWQQLADAAQAERYADAGAREGDGLRVDHVNHLATEAQELAFARDHL